MSSIYGYQSSSTDTRVDELISNQATIKVTDTAAKLKKDLDTGANILSSSITPTNNDHLVNKYYVDNSIFSRSFSIVWNYTAFSNTNYRPPSGPKVGFPAIALMPFNPTANSYLILDTLCIDNDTSGISSSTKVQLALKYITLGTSPRVETLIDTGKIHEITCDGTIGVTTHDRENKMYTYRVNHKIYLSDYQNYERIKALYVTIKTEGGNIHSQCESTLLVTYHE